MYVLELEGQADLKQLWQPKKIGDFLEKLIFQLSQFVITVGCNLVRILLVSCWMARYEKAVKSIRLKTRQGTIV